MSAVLLLHAGIADSRMVVFENSAHSSYRTETARYVKVVGDFLREADH